jgi:hypothetical protein
MDFEAVKFRGKLDIALEPVPLSHHSGTGECGFEHADRLSGELACPPLAAANRAHDLKGHDAGCASGLHVLIKQAKEEPAGGAALDFDRSLPGIGPAVLLATLIILES